MSNVRFVACRFVDNVAGGDGGAISISGTQEVSSVISHSVFESNSAGRDGGALFFQTLRPMRVHESLFVGNEAGERGGAACFDDNGWSVYGCTFVGNHGGTRGGAVHGLAQPSVFVPFPREVTNSILVGNSAPIGSQIDVFNTSADFTVRHSIIEGGASGIQVSQLIAAFGPLVLDVDPRFVDPDGPDGDPLTYADNDYRLSPASPAIDAGSVPSIQPDTTDVDGNGDLNEPCPLDLALALRRRDDPSVVDTGAGTAPIVDMGAFERVP